MVARDGSSGWKVWWVWSFSVALLAPAPVLWAEAVGSPASILKKGKWVMGLSTGMFVERAMDTDADATSFQLGHFRGYGLTDWLSLYAKLGGMQLQVDDPSIKKLNNDQSTTHDFSSGVLLSGGLKARLWHSERLGAEWDAGVQFIRMRARHRGENDARWQEWDFATSVAKSFGRFKPYGGIKYSLVDFDYLIRQNGQFVGQGTYHQDTGVGAFLGTDVYYGEEEQIVLNIEASYTDGPELNVAWQYTF